MTKKEKQAAMIANRLELEKYAAAVGISPLEAGDLFKNNGCRLDLLPGWAEYMPPIAKKDDIELISGEVVPAGAAPDNLEEMIYRAVDEFMAFRCKENKDNMAQCSEDTWAACCSYIGKNVVKPSGIIHDREFERAHGGTKYREDVLLELLDVYRNACATFNKMFSKMAFYDFAGVSYMAVLQKDKGGLNRIHTELFQKLNDYSEDNLRRGVVGGRKGSTLGYTVLLNHDHGYSTSKVEHITAEKSENAAALPLFDGDAE